MKPHSLGYLVIAVLGNRCTQPLQFSTPTHSLKELLRTCVPMLSSQTPFFSPNSSHCHGNQQLTDVTWQQGSSFTVDICCIFPLGLQGISVYCWDCTALPTCGQIIAAKLLAPKAELAGVEVRTLTALQLCLNGQFPPRTTGSKGCQQKFTLTHSPSLFVCLCFCFVFLFFSPCINFCKLLIL